MTDIPKPPKASEIDPKKETHIVLAGASNLMDMYNVFSNPEYGSGIPATGPNCPWCGRPEVENLPAGTKVRCFCDRLYFIAQK